MNAAMELGMPDIDPEFDPLKTLDSNVGDARWKSDSKLFVKFSRRPVLNPHKSTEAGRAIFDEKDFITIWTPGSQLTVIDTPITDGFYLQRFGDRYKQWLAGVEEASSGTPLDLFPFLANKVGLVAELKAMHIHTVEQLATLSDAGTSKLMGGMELREKASKWLAKSSSDAADAEKEQLKAQLAQLQEQMIKLMSAKAGDKPAPATAKSKE